MAERPIRVFVLDDHEIVRRGLAAVLEEIEDVHFVGAAATLAEARRRIPAARPDVAILDVRLPDGSGLDLCREIRTAHRDVRCIVFTPVEDDLLVDAALMAGASAYVLKNVRAGALLEVIRAVARGESPILERLEHNEALRAVHAGGARGPVRLSEREHRILGYISQGLTNREIAMRLSVAEKTVANNVSVLLDKLGVRRRSQAAALAAQVRMLYE